MRIITRTALLLVLASHILLGCSTSPAPNAIIQTPEGKSVWLGEYEFSPPPSPWQIAGLDLRERSLYFSRECPKAMGLYPCESNLAFVEEPFGSSRDLKVRQEQFFRRFLWASRVSFGPPSLRTVNLPSGPALEATIDGEEPLHKHKVFCKVLFAHRGERVVTYFFTQWRPKDADFDLSHLDDLDTFVKSFRFLRPSFYQSL